jgi:hypothetical protein
LNVVAGSQTVMGFNGPQIFVGSGVGLYLDHDPTASNEAATKQYVDAHLPLSGGTLTGPLHAYGNAGGWSSHNIGQQVLITTNSANPALAIGDASESNWWAISNMVGYLRFAAMPALSDGSTPPTYVLELTTTAITVHQPITLPADPTTAMQAATKQYVDAHAGVTLDADGNLGINIAPPAGQYPADPTTGGWLFGGGVTANDWAVNLYWSDTGYRYWNAGFGYATSMQADGSLVWFSTSSGNAGDLAPLATAMSLDTSGNLNVTGSIGIGTTTWFNTSNSDNFYATGDSASIYFQFEAGWYWTWGRTDGQLYWQTPNGALLIMRTSDNLSYNAVGSLGGYGPYLDYSDVRGKQAISPATIGLAEILQLEPINFTRISFPAPQGKQVIHPPEVGFSAQQVRPIIPEAVRAIGIALPDGAGTLESDDPSLAVTTTAILAAAVNAIKELAARVADLESRVNVLD